MITGRKMSRCVVEAMRKAEAQKVIVTGRCPQCGDKLKINPAIIGWWQCESYGRRDNLNCSFQAFGER